MEGNLPLPTKIISGLIVGAILTFTIKAVMTGDWIFAYFGLSLIAFFNIQGSE